MAQDYSNELQQQVKQAVENKTALRIEGGNSKSFYGHPVRGETLDIKSHCGVIRYEPSELFITARAGTPLSEIEAILAENDQCLAFEPPSFTENATLGGTIATGLAGPSRAYRGAVRDFVLGCTVLTGKGDILHYGGEVMKNVAGYDITRLMVGALGTLGIILDVSIKVLPRAKHETTQVLTCEASQAIELMNQWAGQPVPLSATCFDGEHLYLRLSGPQCAVSAAARRIGGEVLDSESTFWQELRDQQLAFFDSSAPLWRISLAPATPNLALPGRTLIEWNGAQRWFIGDTSGDEIRAVTEKQGGHATLFRRDDSTTACEVFHPLPARLRQLHLQLKQTFDPYGILNFGRLYPDL